MTPFGYVHVTSEVKVDETDIVNVKIGQDADATIDAIPGQVFKGKVDGNWLAGGSAELWFGHDTNHDEHQEAKDFKCGDAGSRRKSAARPFDDGKNQNGEKKSVIAIPIRRWRCVHAGSGRGGEERKKESNVTLAAPAPVATGDPKKMRSRGFFHQRQEAMFRP